MVWQPTYGICLTRSFPARVNSSIRKRASTHIVYSVDRAGLPYLGPTSAVNNNVAKVKSEHEQVARQLPPIASWKNRALRGLLVNRCKEN